MTAPEHPITAHCPLNCLETRLPARAFRALQRHLLEQVDHPTVRDLARLCQNNELSGIRDLGAQGELLVTRLLEQTGLVTTRATPYDSAYNANY